MLFFCMFSLFNFSSIFAAGQLTRICPHVGTPMVSMLNKQSVSDNHPTPSPISPQKNLIGFRDLHNLQK